MNEKLTNIINKLKSARNLETIHLLLSGFLYFLSVVFASFLIVAFIEAIARGDVSFRTILFFLLLIVTTGAFVFFIVPNILRILGIRNLPDIYNISERVGNFYPDLKDRLTNSLQAVKSLGKHHTSENLAQAYFLDVYQQTADKDFSIIVEKKKTRKSAFIFLAVALISSFIFLIFSNYMIASIERVINFNKEFIPPAPFTIKIKPEYLKLTKGESVEIIIETKGTPPDVIDINIKEEQQQEYERLSLTADTNGMFIYRINSVKTSIDFYASADWLNTEVKSNPGRIEVLNRPIIRSISGKLTYPAYTGTQGIVFNEQNADITAIKGTKASFVIFSSSELAKAELVLLTDKKNNADSIAGSNASDTSSIKLRLTGRKAEGSFVIRSNGKYFFKLTDKNGVENEAPILYSFIALNDEYPEIELVQPLNDVQVNETALLPILVNVNDDYGFSSLKLYYKLIKSNFAEPDRKYSSISIPFSKNTLSMQIPFLWDLNSINIAPEDVYEFYLEISDNDIVNGPKTNRTKTIAVRLPSLDEVLETADDMQKEIQEEVKELLKETEEVKKDMEKMKRELMQKPKGSQIDWKEKKQAEDLMKKQDKMQSKIEDIQKKMSDLTQKLEENKAISPETLQKYQELQKLMREVSSPELKKLQEQMQQALQNMDPEALKKAMENAKFNEEQFRKSIERTIKMLKRLQAEQKADAIQKRADELLKKQEELSKKTDNTNPADKEKGDELANEQENLKKELDNVGQDLKELENLMKEIGENMPMEEMQQAKTELNQEQTSSEMQKAAQQIKKSDMSKANQSQKKAEKNISKFSDAMKNLKQKMQDNVNKEAVQKMKKALDDMLELSKQQESLKQQTKNTDYNSTKIPDLSQKQAQIEEGLKNVANSMLALSEKSMAVTPEMGQQLGNAMQHMDNAQNSLSNRSLQTASSSQTNAMESMNKAASQMQSMLNSMQNSDGSCNNPGGEGQGKGSGMSFSQKMQEAARQQQGLNNSLQQMMGNMPKDGGSLTQQQQAEIGRIAKEQGKAKKAMEELAREQKELGGGKRALGDLEKIAKEMQEVVSDLQSNNITPETLAKQERILSRLLDANVSMNERDFEKNRESKSGKQYDRNDPAPLNMKSKDDAERAFREMNNALKQGYSKDY